MEKRFKRIVDVPYYILKDKQIVKAKDIMEWGMFMQYGDRTVENTVLPDGVRVSTVFLGLDHGLFGPPKLFETMVFGGEHNHYVDRYHTWDEAVEGHYATLDMIFGV